MYFSEFNSWHAQSYLRCPDLVEEYERIAALGAVPYVLEVVPPEEPRQSLHMTCTICYEDLEIADLIWGLQCDHLYHGNCISKWLRDRGFCQFCRKKSADNQTIRNMKFVCFFLFICKITEIKKCPNYNSSLQFIALTSR